MGECFGQYYILNGRATLSDSFNNSLIYEGESVYEVLRLINGIPVFFDDHIDRLEASAMIRGRSLLSDRKSLRNDVINLAGLVKTREVNLKIVFNYNTGEGNCLVYYIEPVYPGGDQYKKGVKGILYYAERKDPLSKVINAGLRSEIFHKLIMENAYEALLVNRNGYITEGSRSNIFFIKDDYLVTSPDEFVLRGITRKYLLEICHYKGISVKFECIEADSIADYECVIMTGTSPVVLPFSNIGEYSFNVNHHLIATLRDEYLKRAEISREKFIKMPPAPDQESQEHSLKAGDIP